MQVREFIFLFLCLSGSLVSHGQDFYYQEVQPRSGDSLLTYYSFLVVQPDGSATARIRYINPSDRVDHLMELQLRDSIPPGKPLDDTIHYLIATNAPFPITEWYDNSFISPVYIFQKVSDSSGARYQLSAASGIDSSGNLYAMKVLRSEERSLASLHNEMDFVRVFYSEWDPFYQFVETGNTRGLIPQRTGNLYLIAVANTLDASIGASSKKDLDNVVFTFDRLARSAGIRNIILTEITGNTFSKANVENTINNLRVTPNDIIIYYYSGHGFRYEADKSPYPRMSFRTKQNPSAENNNLEVESVFNKLKSKNARVTIVLSDCCNENIGAEPRRGREPLKTRGILAPAKQSNVDALFFPKTPLAIIGSSTAVNQLASGNPSIGGFFTHYMLMELEQQIYTYSTIPPSWIQLLAKAREKARYQALSALCGQSRCQQTATFRVRPEM